jgi:glycosyltransferase involved in cell wall biosynthesis
MRISVVAVMPEPTPYRSPLFDLLAERPELDLTVIYSARAIAGNDWRLRPSHPHLFLRGLRVPGADRVLRHAYPVTPGIVRELERRRPDCVVLTGWSTFASQAAIAWCRLRRVPYVLIVESHDHGSRTAWRKAVKGAVVPWVVRHASSLLVTGSLARASVLARGADPARVRVFANTVDVDRFERESATVRRERAEVRARLGIEPETFAVLCVARLAQEKGIDLLLRAAPEGSQVLLVGGGPERDALEQLAGSIGVRASFVGVVPWEDIVRYYAAADVFALLSRHEPWGVAVTEAAACGLPLVLSDAVGAAHDLLRDGENGVLVPTGDVGAPAAALRLLADDKGFREAAAARSLELVASWGYGPSVEAFVEAVVSTLAP